MKRKLVFFSLMCFAIAQVFGWGVTGHRATGLIAEHYLNAKAKKRIALILERESLAMVSTWMDEIRSDSTFNYTTDWHYTTIPDGKLYEDIGSNPDGKVVVIVEKITGDLTS